MAWRQGVLLRSPKDRILEVSLFRYISLFAKIAKIDQNTMKRPWEPPQSTQKITPDPAMKVPEGVAFFRFFAFIFRQSAGK